MTAQIPGGDLHRRAHSWRLDERRGRRPRPPRWRFAATRSSSSATTRAPAGAPPEAVEVDLAGRLVTPAFVDAHVHLIQAGLVMNGLDLHGVPSRARLLAAVADFARRHSRAKIIVGQGWDERGWPEAEPPTRAQLDRAAGAIPVYLARVDVHSAVVSTALLDQLPGLTELAGYRADGLLTRDAHHRCRGQLDRLFSDDERRAAAAAALRVAVGQGVATVHELGGPHLGPLEDLTRVREVARELGLGVVCYWGEKATPESIQRARAVGAAGLAGDLCVDGAIGSRTARVARRVRRRRQPRRSLSEPGRDRRPSGRLHPGRTAGRLPLHRRRRGRRRGGGTAARRPGARSGADPSRPAPAGTSGDDQRRRRRDAGRARCRWPASNRRSTPPGAVPASSTSNASARTGQRR